MKKLKIAFVLLVFLSFSFIFNKQMNAISLNKKVSKALFSTEGLENYLETADAGFVAAVGSSGPEVGNVFAVDGAFSFSTNGTYPTINENLVNGFAVTISDGTGDLVLSGAQTAALTIDNQGKNIRIINGNFNHTMHMWNTNVQLINTTIDTSDSYGILINHDVSLYIDATSLVKVQNAYASALEVNPNMQNVKIEIDGKIQSNMQCVGVNVGSILDSIIIRGEITSNNNFGLVATDQGTINYIEFSPTSYALNPLGVAVYAVNSSAVLGNVVLDGKLEVNRIAVIGATGNTPTAGNLTLNNEAIVNGEGFIVRGSILDITLTANSTFDQKINNYGILYTAATASIRSLNIYGTVYAAYLVGDTYATSHITRIHVDPILIGVNASITSNKLFWITGIVDSIELSSNVIGVTNVYSLFSLQASARVGSILVDKSIIDAEQYDPLGFIFNNKALSNITSLTFNDTLLFGDALNVSINSTVYQHIVPTITTSNLRNDLGTYYVDITIPELASYPNIQTSGVKLTYMFPDYSHSNDFMYYGGNQTIAVPAGIMQSNQTFTIVNYAVYNTPDTVLLTSHRSQPLLIDTYQLHFDLNGGDGNAPATQTLVEAALATPVSQPSRSGYHFINWNTALDGSGTSWDFTASRMPAQDVTLYAQWSKIPTFELSFNLNGGTSSPISSQTLEAGTLAQQPNPPTRSGYEFDSWNTQSDGLGTSWNFATSMMPSQNITLYAQWKQNQPILTFELTFDLNGGTSNPITKQVLKSGALANQPASPTRSGYDFVAWNTSRDGTGVNWKFDTNTMPNQNLTLYALWTKKDTPPSGDTSNIYFYLLILLSSSLFILRLQKQTKK